MSEFINDKMADSVKEKLLDSLPFTSNDYNIRLCNRNDLDMLSAWPAYPWPYTGFCFSFSALNTREKDVLFKKRARQIDRITLVIDHPDARTIGYFALVDIDWRNRKARNMSVRIHPQCCGRGIGTLILKSIVGWWFGKGMISLRLDVAASNMRAVRCYEKAGFLITGEFWNKADELVNVDINDSKYHFLKQYVRFKNGFPEIKFFFMEIRKKKI